MSVNMFKKPEEGSIPTPRKRKCLSARQEESTQISKRKKASFEGHSSNVITPVTAENDESVYRNKKNVSRVGKKTSRDAFLSNNLLMGLDDKITEQNMCDIFPSSSETYILQPRSEQSNLDASLKVDSKLRSILSPSYNYTANESITNLDEVLPLYCDEIQSDEVIFVGEASPSKLNARVNRQEISTIRSPNILMDIPDCDLNHPFTEAIANINDPFNIDDVSQFNELLKVDFVKDITIVSPNKMFPSHETSDRIDSLLVSNCEFDFKEELIPSISDIDLLTQKDPNTNKLTLSDKVDNDSCKLKSFRDTPQIKEEGRDRGQAAPVIALQNAQMRLSDRNKESSFAEDVSNIKDTFYLNNAHQLTDARVLANNEFPSQTISKLIDPPPIGKADVVSDEESITSPVDIKFLSERNPDFDNPQSTTERYSEIESDELKPHMQVQLNTCDTQHHDRKGSIVEPLNKPKALTFRNRKLCLNKFDTKKDDLTNQIGMFFKKCCVKNNGTTLPNKIVPLLSKSELIENMPSETLSIGYGDELTPPPSGIGVSENPSNLNDLTASQNVDIKSDAIEYGPIKRYDAKDNNKEVPMVRSEDVPKKLSGCTEKTASTEPVSNTSDHISLNDVSQLEDLFNIDLIRDIAMSPNEMFLSQPLSSQIDPQLIENIDFDFKKEYIPSLLDINLLTQSKSNKDDLTPLSSDDSESNELINEKEGTRNEKVIQVDYNGISMGDSQNAPKTLTGSNQNYLFTELMSSGDGQFIKDVSSSLDGSFINEDKVAECYKVNPSKDIGVVSTAETLSLQKRSKLISKLSIGNVNVDDKDQVTPLLLCGKPNSNPQLQNKCGQFQHNSNIDKLKNLHDVTELDEVKINEESTVAPIDRDPKEVLILIPQNKPMVLKERNRVHSFPEVIINGNDNPYESNGREIKKRFEIDPNREAAMLSTTGIVSLQKRSDLTDLNPKENIKENSESHLSSSSWKSNFLTQGISAKDDSKILRDGNIGFNELIPHEKESPNKQDSPDYQNDISMLGSPNVPMELSECSHEHISLNVIPNGDYSSNRSDIHPTWDRFSNQDKAKISTEKMLNLHKRSELFSTGPTENVDVDEKQLNLRPFDLNSVLSQKIIEVNNSSPVRSVDVNGKPHSNPPTTNKNSHRGQDSKIDRLTSNEFNIEFDQLIADINEARNTDYTQDQERDVSLIESLNVLMTSFRPTHTPFTKVALNVDNASSENDMSKDREQLENDIINNGSIVMTTVKDSLQEKSKLNNAVEVNYADLNSLQPSSPLPWKNDIQTRHRSNADVSPPSLDDCIQSEHFISDGENPPNELDTSNLLREVPFARPQNVSVTLSGSDQNLPFTEVMSDGAATSNENVLHQMWKWFEMITDEDIAKFASGANFSVLEQSENNDPISMRDDNQITQSDCTSIEQEPLIKYDAQREPILSMLETNISPQESDHRQRLSIENNSFRLNYQDFCDDIEQCIQFYHYLYYVSQTQKIASTMGIDWHLLMPSEKPNLFKRYTEREMTESSFLREYLLRVSDEANRIFCEQMLNSSKRGEAHASMAHESNETLNRQRMPYHTTQYCMNSINLPINHDNIHLASHINGLNSRVQLHQADAAPAEVPPYEPMFMRMPESQKYPGLFVLDENAFPSGARPNNINVGASSSKQHFLSSDPSMAQQQTSFESYKMNQNACRNHFRYNYENDAILTDQNKYQQSNLLNQIPQFTHTDHAIPRSSEDSSRNDNNGQDIEGEEDDETVSKSTKEILNHSDNTQGEMPVTFSLANHNPFITCDGYNHVNNSTSTSMPYFNLNDSSMVQQKTFFRPFEISENSRRNIFRMNHGNNASSRNQDIYSHISLPEQVSTWASSEHPISRSLDETSQIDDHGLEDEGEDDGETASQPLNPPVVRDNDVLEEMPVTFGLGNHYPISTGNRHNQVNIGTTTSMPYFNPNSPSIAQRPTFFRPFEINETSHRNYFRINQNYNPLPLYTSMDHPISPSLDDTTQIDVHEQDEECEDDGDLASSSVNVRADRNFNTQGEMPATFCLTGHIPFSSGERHYHENIGTPTNMQYFNLSGPSMVRQPTYFRPFEISEIPHRNYFRMNHGNNVPLAGHIYYPQSSFPESVPQYTSMEDPISRSLSETSHCNDNEQDGDSEEDGETAFESSNRPMGRDDITQREMPVTFSLNSHIPLSSGDRHNLDSFGTPTNTQYLNLNSPSMVQKQTHFLPCQMSEIPHRNYFRMNHGNNVPLAGHIYYPQSSFPESVPQYTSMEDPISRSLSETSYCNDNEQDGDSEEDGETAFESSNRPMGRDDITQREMSVTFNLDSHIPLSSGDRHNLDSFGTPTNTQYLNLNSPSMVQKQTHFLPCQMSEIPHRNYFRMNHGNNVPLAGHIYYPQSSFPESVPQYTSMEDPISRSLSETSHCNDNEQDGDSEEDGEQHIYSPQSSFPESVPQYTSMEDPISRSLSETSHCNDNEQDGDSEEDDEQHIYSPQSSFPESVPQHTSMEDPISRSLSETSHCNDNEQDGDSEEDGETAFESSNRPMGRDDITQREMPVTFSLDSHIPLSSGDRHNLDSFGTPTSTQYLNLNSPSMVQKQTHFLPCQMSEIPHRNYFRMNHGNNAPLLDQIYYSQSNLPEQILQYTSTEHATSYSSEEIFENNESEQNSEEDDDDDVASQSSNVRVDPVVKTLGNDHYDSDVDVSSSMQNFEGSEIARNNLELHHENNVFMNEQYLGRQTFQPIVNPKNNVTESLITHPFDERLQNKVNARDGKNGENGGSDSDSSNLNDDRCEKTHGKLSVPFSLDEHKSLTSGGQNNGVNVGASTSMQYNNCSCPSVDQQQINASPALENGIIESSNRIDVSQLENEYSLQPGDSPIVPSLSTNESDSSYVFDISKFNQDVVAFMCNYKALSLTVPIEKCGTRSNITNKKLYDNLVKAIASQLYFEQMVVAMQKEQVDLSGLCDTNMLQLLRYSVKFSMASSKQYFEDITALNNRLVSNGSNPSDRERDSQLPASSLPVDEPTESTSNLLHQRSCNCRLFHEESITAATGKLESFSECNNHN